MAPFEKIVVGTDGSETAEEAVRQAAVLAKLAGGRLEVVSALEPVPALRTTGEKVSAPGDVQHEFGPREDVNFVLEKALRIAAGEGVEARPHPMEGDPADAILDVADEIGADLIVVGNKGMTGAGRFLLGSVPNKISHHARCGVFIARTT
jgi:nucleotide-binding universal stress UspA family protein